MRALITLVALALTAAAAYAERVQPVWGRITPRTPR